MVTGGELEHVDPVGVFVNQACDVLACEAARGSGVSDIVAAGVAEEDLECAAILRRLAAIDIYVGDVRRRSEGASRSSAEYGPAIA